MYKKSIKAKIFHSYKMCQICALANPGGGGTENNKKGMSQIKNRQKENKKERLI